MRISAAVAVTVLSYIREASACTAIGIGRDASASGFPMVGHSEDSGPSTNDVRLVRAERQQWPEGSTRPLYLWQAGYPRVVSNELRTADYAPVDGQVVNEVVARIPQVKETWAYWDTDYGVQNEWGLSIGESTCTGRTVGWSSNYPYGHNNVGIEDISKIALERCKTARCAAQTMGDIAVEQGFYSADSGDPSAPSYSGSSECLLLADATPGEVWIFNILTGKNNASAIWAAERIPSDHVTIAANTFTIRKLNFSDSDNFLYSPGVSSLAEEMGWWSPELQSSTDIFDFFYAYGYTPPASNVNEMNLLDFYSGRRMWRVFSVFSPEEGAKLDPNKGNLPHTRDPYPNSVKAPKGSVSLQMVQDMYRDHYEGTPYDLTVGMAAGPFGNPNRGPAPDNVIGLWERAISMYRTTWSFVLEAKPKGRSLTWFGWDSPHGTAYLPLFGAASAPAPASFHGHDGHMSKFSRNCAFWAFSIVSQYQDRNYRLIHADVIENAHRIEREAVAAVAAWETHADRAGSDADALSLLTERSNAFVHKHVEEYWDFAFSLFAKFHHYGTTTGENGEAGMVLDHYPLWWLESPEVGFTSWTRNGPFHGVMLKVSRQASALVERVGGASMERSAWLCITFFVMFFSHQVGLQRGKQQVESQMDTYYHVQA